MSASGSNCLRYRRRSALCSGRQFQTPLADQNQCRPVKIDDGIEPLTRHDTKRFPCRLTASNAPFQEPSPVENDEPESLRTNFDGQQAERHAIVDFRVVIHVSFCATPSAVRPLAPFSLRSFSNEATLSSIAFSTVAAIPVKSAEIGVWNIFWYASAMRSGGTVWDRSCRETCQERR